MDNQIIQIAERIRGLRQILNISAEEMARITETSLENYTAYEEGKSDFSFTFLLKCAQTFNVDIAELVMGDVPKLSVYTIIRGGNGMPIERRKGFKYRHLAYLLKNRLAEPHLVTAFYSEEEQTAPIRLSRHAGQEFDYIVKGKLKFCIDGHEEILETGDSVYYNSAHSHGMIATGGEDCDFLAIVIPDEPDAKGKD